MPVLRLLILLSTSSMAAGQALQGCPFDVQAFLQVIDNVCNPFVQAVQVNSPSVRASTRIVAANDLQLCQSIVAEATYSNNPNLLEAVGNISVTSISGNATYPSYSSFVSTACAFTSSLVQGTCISNASTFFQQHTRWGRFERCMNQLPLQYVRCTHSENITAIPACINSTHKVDWLKQITSYEGADKCPKIDGLLAQLAVSLVVTTCVSLLVSGNFWKIMNAKRKQKQRKSAYVNYAEEAQPSLNDYDSTKVPSATVWSEQDATAVSSAPEPKLFRRAHTFQMTAYGMIFAMGVEVLTSYLTALLVSGHRQTKDLFLRDLAFYIIRPRAAPLIGVFGLFEPWYKKGLDPLLVDGIISYLAGTWIGIQFMVSVLAPATPLDPATPTEQLKVLVAGAFISFGPALAVHVAIFIYSMFEVLRQDWRRRTCGCGYGEFYGAIGTMFGHLFTIAIVFAAAPLIAIIELYIIVSNFQVFRKGQPKTQMPLTFLADDKKLGKFATFVRFDRFYWFFLSSSWIINIGNWIFFASYLKLEGDMYCPTNIGHVVLVWYVVPIIGHALLGGLQAIAGD